MTLRRAMAGGRAAAAGHRGRRPDGPAASSPASPPFPPGPGCASAPAAPASLLPGCSTGPSCRPRARAWTRRLLVVADGSAQAARGHRPGAPQGRHRGLDPAVPPAGSGSSCGRPACTRPRVCPVRSPERAGAPAEDAYWRGSEPARYVLLTSRVQAGSGQAADERADAVREALAEVIDPDLGVNIVDLGFVRGVEIGDRTAVITMTLTSAACPLSQIMEDQIRTGLAPLGGIDGLPGRLAVGTSLAARRHHRQRPRPAARHRLQLLSIGPEGTGAGA